MINLIIDDQTVAVKEGTTILDAARQAGIRIPTLCHQPDLRPYGACRMCVIENRKMPGRLFAACTTPVTEGMEVVTRTPGVEKVRRRVLQLLLLDYPLDCEDCAKAGDCELQTLTQEYGVTKTGIKWEQRNLAPEVRSPFIDMDYNRCILCGRCVRVCNEIIGANAIDFVKRGISAVISTPFGRPLDCEHCGQCIEACPTGALSSRVSRPIQNHRELERTRTTCTYCGVGCSLYLETEDGEVKRVAGAPDGVNKGVLCVKGRFGFEFINHPDRLRTPLIKKDGRFVEATWDEALDLVASKLSEYKGDVFAGLTSAKCTNEENYLFERFVRGVMGTNNIDHCARL